MGGGGGDAELLSQLCFLLSSPDILHRRSDIAKSSPNACGVLRQVSCPCPLTLRPTIRGLQCTTVAPVWQPGLSHQGRSESPWLPPALHFILWDTHSNLIPGWLQLPPAGAPLQRHRSSAQAGAADHAGVDAGLHPRLTALVSTSHPSSPAVLKKTLSLQLGPPSPLPLPSH